MKKFISCFMCLIMISAALTSCAGENMRETPVTAVRGPADAALPHQAVFAIGENADARLISAAKSFCDRTIELSKGGTVFNLVFSGNALEDLRLGRADVILLENSDAPEFSAMTEAFRYKSYEHFSMTANSAATLRKLSDILKANVFAGFYAGSDVFLSRGTLDAKFKAPILRDEADERDIVNIPVTTLEAETANAFSLLGANVSAEKAFNARIASFAQNAFVVELSPSELDSDMLLEFIRSDAYDMSEMPSSNVGADTEAYADELEPLVITQAFTGIKPVWLVFAPSAYERLSQTGRAAVAEAVAYMTADIDGAYLEYERERIDLLLAEDVARSYDFTSTRFRVLRLADESDTKTNADERRLREIISKIQ